VICDDRIVVAEAARAKAEEQTRKVEAAVADTGNIINFNQSIVCILLVNDVLM
jgi:hypothetical protein